MKATARKVGARVPVRHVLTPAYAALTAKNAVRVNVQQGGPRHSAPQTGPRPPGAWDQNEVPSDGGRPMHMGASARKNTVRVNVQQGGPRHSAPQAGPRPPGAWDQSQSNAMPQQNISSRGSLSPAKSARGGANSGVNGQGARNSHNGQPHNVAAKRPSQGERSPDKKTKIEDTNVSDSPTKLKKFNNFARLYIGNLAQGITEQEVRDFFKEFSSGEKIDLFLDSNKGFGFVKLPHRHLAIAAKEQLDDKTLKGRPIRIRFGKHSGALTVKNLGSAVSNELLYKAFKQFGELEKAIVLVDDHNKNLGEGRVYFVQKNRALAAMGRINDGIFFLGSSPRPIVCEELEHVDDEDGLQESLVISKRFYQKETEMEPRFAVPESPEYAVGARWRDLYESYRNAKNNLEEKFQKDCQAMEVEMDRTLQEMEVHRIRENIERQRREMEFLEQQIGRRYEPNDRSGNVGMRFPPPAPAREHQYPGVPIPEAYGQPRNPPVNRERFNGMSPQQNQLQPGYLRGPPPPDMHLEYGRRTPPQIRRG